MRKTTAHKETPEICEKHHKNTLAIIKISAPVGFRCCSSQFNTKISCIMFAQICPS